ncbi:MAG: hypothetical protein VKL39_13750 [Leptolyngbyaceae bacterium]|nr:hypothetical protein [Leptolyngbyaceae bacterium]
MSKSGWIAMDLDGTLVKYDKWVSAGHIGEPVVPMVKRVQDFLAEGREVRIFTARCWPLVLPLDVSQREAIEKWFAQSQLEVVQEFDASPERITDALTAVKAIHEWTEQVFGQPLVVTCVKDYFMYQLFDDRAVSVQKNTGSCVSAEGAL